MAMGMDGWIDGWDTQVMRGRRASRDVRVALTLGRDTNSNGLLL